MICAIQTAMLLTLALSIAAKGIYFETVYRWILIDSASCTNPVYTALSGNFTNNVYDNNLDCLYTIRPNVSTALIKVTFIKFHTERNHDTLSITQADGRFLGMLSMVHTTTHINERTILRYWCWVEWWSGTILARCLCSRWWSFVEICHRLCHNRDWMGIELHMYTRYIRYWW